MKNFAHNAMRLVDKTFDTYSVDAHLRDRVWTATVPASPVWDEIWGHISAEIWTARVSTWMGHERV